MVKKYNIGYTSGVFDLFHIGHLNVLRNAKTHCNKLIVGVTDDELVRYKNKKSVIPFVERIEIVKHIDFVDEVVCQSDMNKMSMWRKLKFDVMFVGDDWKGTDKWNNIEEQFSKINVDLIYFPYTKGTSSTLINSTLENLRKN
jgi:glycerol-3-phosphate cytidylyltransferase